MIEGEADFVSEAQMKEAMYLANDAVRKQCEAQIELAKRAGRAKKDYKLYLVPEELAASMAKLCADRIENVCTIPARKPAWSRSTKLRRRTARRAARTGSPQMSDAEFGFWNRDRVRQPCP